jgi:GxxExxY protein
LGLNTSWGMAPLPHFQITEQIIESAIHVHKALGPGLLESAYQRCLAHHLRKRGLTIDEEVSLNLKFEDLTICGAYKIDMIVERAVLLELKAVESLSTIHVSQAITYLKFSGLEAGLILNFNSVVLREGLRRVFPNKRTP